MQSRNNKAVLQQEELAETIAQINEAAFAHSQKKQYDLAIKKLKQGEQLLQYAAESCCNIRRELIIVILHNIVSLSQTQWDLPTASNYLEGLIYNFQLTNSSRNSSRITIEDTPASACLPEEDAKAHSHLAEYYLQYCAINSQLRKHRNAQSAARKSLRIIASLLKQSEWIKQIKNSEIHQFQIKRSILKYLLDHWENCSDKDHASSFITMCENLWKVEISSNKKSAMQAQLRAFSIGNVMTLEYKHFKVQRTGQLHRNTCFNFVLISMSLFSLATEARFDSEQKLNEAKHYHSLAILFYLIFIPFESPYIQHIKQNYLKNYGPFVQLQHSPASTTYHDLLSRIRRDSVLESSLNLQQESINSIQQEKRRNERLKQQNLKLKMLCLAQVKPKRHQKSYEKAKSLTISHSNTKKASIDSKRCERAIKNINKTNLNCVVKPDCLHHSKENENKKRRHEKDVLGNHNRDEIAEKYFEMAFKKDKIKSPQPKRKNSIRSTSSTTKDKSGNQSKNIVRKSKQKNSAIKSRKVIRK